MAWAFDPAKCQSQEPQNKHFRFQKVHPDDTCGKNEEYEAGQLLMSLQERPGKNKTVKTYFFGMIDESGTILFRLL